LRSTASRSATIPWRWSRLSSVGAATSFAFAGVLSLAAIITTVTATLALTLVLAFAPVLALFRVSHRLQRDAGFLGVRLKGTNPEGSRQKAGNCRAGYLRNLFSQWLWPVLGTLEQLAFLFRREFSKQDSEWIQALPSQHPALWKRKNSKARGPNRHFVRAATIFNRLIACSCRSKAVTAW